MVGKRIRRAFQRRANRPHGPNGGDATSRQSRKTENRPSSIASRSPWRFPQHSTLTARCSETGGRRATGPVSTGAERPAEYDAKRTAHLRPTTAPQKKKNCVCPLQRNRVRRLGGPANRVTGSSHHAAQRPAVAVARWTSTWEGPSRRPARLGTFANLLAPFLSTPPPHVLRTELRRIACARIPPRVTEVTPLCH